MKYAFAIAAAAAFTATAALAGHHEMKGEGKDMKAMDARVETHFKEVDANADGKVSEQELVDFVTTKAKKEFAAMAGDDGLVSFDEMKAHHKAKHDEMMKEHGDMDHSKMDHGEHKG